MPPARRAFLPVDRNSPTDVTRGVASLTHKSHHRDDKVYPESQVYADFERGHRDGLYNHSCDNHSRSDASSYGYRSGVDEREQQSSCRRNGHAGNQPSSEYSMTSRILTALATAALALAQPAMAQQQTVVSFAKGTSAQTLKDSIKGDQDHSYIVDARAGQTLTVDFKPSNASAYFNVIAPGADSAMFIGSSGGNRFSGPLTTSGRHTVQVYLMRNAARRGEVANYTITIGVTGAAAAAPRPSQDALVAGTNYNATAVVPCITAADAPKGRCKAGVMRMAGGETTVEIQTADGGQRHIYFKNGRPDSSDANAPMQATRQGDVNIIRIGTVEVYEIPDAFVVGG